MLRALRREPGFYQKLWALSAPIILQNIITTSLGFADTFMVGLLGNAEMAAVTAANVPVFIIQIVIFGFQSGMAVLVSQYWGRGDVDNINRCMGVALYAVTGFSTVLALITFFFPSQVLGLITPNQELVALGARYIQIVGFSYILNGVSSIYAGLHRSTEYPKFGMALYGISMCVNTFLNYVLIFGKFGAPAMGVTGAAAATVIAQLVMLMWQLHLFSNPKDMIRLHRDVMHLKRRIVRDSLVIGLPPFLINLCACLVAVIVTRSMARYGGDEAVGAFGITNRLLLFVVMVVIGLNQGMQPIAGYNFGARKYDRVIGVLKRAVLFATLITTTGFLAGMFFARPCVSLFAKDSPELVDQAARGLRIVVMFFPVIGVQIVSTAFFQSIGYAGKSIFLSLTRQLIFLLPLLLVLPHWFKDPVEGVWYAMPMADCVSTVLAVTMLTLQIKKFRKIPQTVS